MENKIFYNLLSADYDEMISFEESLKRKQDLFKNMITPGMKNAADCGCGTGVDSIALSKLGLNVNGFDPSHEMISRAKSNSDLVGEKISFNNYPIHGIPDKFNHKFDLVISLGNTFANIYRDNFDNSIRRCFEILNPGGTLIIHILNYQKILKEQNRIVNITQGKENCFIRFYDFEKDEMKFNILTYKSSDPSKYKLITTKILSHTKEEFSESMLNCGFSQIEFYSNLKFKGFNVKISKDLFIRAFRKH